MEALHRQVLNRNTVLLSGDSGIEMTDDLTKALLTSGLFGQSWIERFLVEGWTNERKVSRMLELLPKRGPGAFDTFTSILENEYPWLAIALQMEVKHIGKDESTSQRIRLDSVDSGYDPSPKASPDVEIGNPLDNIGTQTKCLDDTFAIQYEINAARRERENLTRQQHEFQHDAIEAVSVKKRASARKADKLRGLKKCVQSLGTMLDSHEPALRQKLYDEFHEGEMVERSRHKTGKDYRL